MEEDDTASLSAPTLAQRESFEVTSIPSFAAPKGVPPTSRVRLPSLRWAFGMVLMQVGAGRDMRTLLHRFRRSLGGHCRRQTEKVKSAKVQPVVRSTLPFPSSIPTLTRMEGLQTTGTSPPPLLPPPVDLQVQTNITTGTTQSYPLQ